MESREIERRSPLGNLRRELAKVIEGQVEVVESLMVALIAGGHVLIEGVPGVAKTLVARSLAAALGMEFSRIQFTPDLMPADITGVNVFEPKTADFQFRAGPLFADIVLADEINRAPAKTQSALLEAMQELQVTIDGATHELSPVMTVIATQNPLEYEGTYPLPEAQLDRFMMKVLVEYPDADTERAMLERMHRLGANVVHPEQVIQPVIDRSNLIELRQRALGEPLGLDIAVEDVDGERVRLVLAQIRLPDVVAVGAPGPRADVVLTGSGHGGHRGNRLL